MVRHPLQAQLQQDRESFEIRFGAGRELIWAAAPGRVNLIGEHTDYHEGLVLPVAIDRYVRVLAAASDDAVVTIRSVTFDDQHRFSLDQPMGAVQGWARRAEGILRELLVGSRDEPMGLDLLIDADLPPGGGLSSSAAAMAALGAAAAKGHGVELEPVAFARMLQQAERRYAGLRCGLMDQLAVLLGQRGQALRVDCRTLETQRVPLPEAWAIVVLDTSVKHDLASSEYNLRQRECEAVLEQVRRRRPEVKTLRDVAHEDLDAAAASSDTTGINRCRHVIDENERVNQAVIALDQGDQTGLDELFRASHESLRDLYEVSCPELDALVEAARDAPGCVAARMTGGGFGGSTVNLVQRDQTAAFSQAALASYRKRTGLQGAAIVAASADGLAVGTLS
jgi:galactokinase